jgi:MFS family permease
MDEFTRDGSTLLSYGVLAAYAFWLYAFGPALALLRAELHFSYTLIGVYSALWSGGAALAGLVFAWLARRLGRHATLWWGASGASAAALLFAFAPAVAPGLVAAGLLGLAGTTLLMVTQSVLADRHGVRRDRALAEANVGAAGCAVLAPLMLGALAGTAVGWRIALVLPLIALAALYVVYRQHALPVHPSSPSAGQRRVCLPLAYWLLALLVAIGIAVEFCLVYFGAEQLDATGLSTGGAATAVSAFYVGILLARIAGARLTRAPGRTVTLLWASLALTAAGFLPFWLIQQPLVAIAGLFVCGVGIANLYPLSLALALAVAPQHTDAANARMQLLGGVLVITAPYLLGSLADHLGLRSAFTVEPVLITLSALLLLAGIKATGRHNEKPTLARRRSPHRHG